MFFNENIKDNYDNVIIQFDYLIRNFNNEEVTICIKKLHLNETKNN